MLLKKMFVLLLLLLLTSAVYAGPLQKMEIVNAVNRKAICNDGTPGVYWYRQGFGSGTHRWILSLNGGYFCNTPGCDGRHPSLMSSLGAPSTISPRGLLSDSSIVNPDFYNANIVFIHYCSSDLWAGNRLESLGSRPIQFRGRNIVRGVITDLKSKSGTNLLSPGTEILLMGTSAGGTGVMVHLDWLAKQLPKAKVKGFNDSGWFPEESSLVSPPFENEIAKGIPLWEGRTDFSCELANATKKSKCYLSTAYPYITTPLFIAESQWDWAFVTDTAQPSAAEFAKAVRDSLIPVHAAFSPRIFAHGLSDDRGFSTSKIGNVSLRDVLGNWFFERAGPVKMIK